MVAIWEVGSSEQDVGIVTSANKAGKFAVLLQVGWLMVQVVGT